MTKSPASSVSTPDRSKSLKGVPVQVPNPLKVLLVMPLAEQRGGGELMLLQLIEHGRTQGIAWMIAFFCDGAMVSQVRSLGVEAVVIPAGRLRQPHRMLAAILKLRRLIREQQINLVFSWMGKAQLYGGIAAWLAGVSCMWYQLGLPDPAGWQDRIATIIPSRRVLTCSDAATQAQAKLWPHRSSFTVHPGVDLRRFDPSQLPSAAECRRKLGLPVTGPLIGIVGRLQRWKGIHHLIEAMPAVLERYPDAHAVIVGGDHAFEPEYPSFLNQRIAQLGLQNWIILSGLQSNVPEWMQAMDVIVHASDAEPFGIVVIEAMALCKPTIATSTAGPTEIITDSVNGWLWSPGNVPQLAAAIMAILALQSAEIQEKGNLARQRASDFDVKRYASAVCQRVTEAFVTI